MADWDAEIIEPWPTITTSGGGGQYLYWDAGPNPPNVKGGFFDDDIAGDTSTTGWGFFDGGSQDPSTSLTPPYVEGVIDPIPAEFLSAVSPLLPPIHVSPVGWAAELIHTCDCTSMNTEQVYFVMRAHDGTLGHEVFWTSLDTVDSNGHLYTGPGPLTNIMWVARLCGHPS